MSHNKKYLGVFALVVTSVVAFSLGYLFAKKHDGGKAKVGEASASDIKVIGTKLNVNNSAISINPYSMSSPIHHEFEEFKKWVMNNKKLAVLSDSPNSDHLLRLSGKLEAKGVTRLPTNLLEQRFSSVNKILPSLDTRMCSAFLKGGFDALEFLAQATSTMESFSSDEAKAWFAVNKAAIEAQLDGVPPIVLSTEDATRGVLKIVKSMYEPESKTFLSGMVGLKTASDEDVCKTVRTFYSKGNALPEPYRGYVARMLLTGKEGNEKF